AEEQVIRQLKALQKPFAVVLNSAHPDSAEAQGLRSSLESKYDVPVTLLNVKDMTAEDAQQLLSQLLMEFPLREVRFSVPGWMGALDENHWLPAHAVELVRSLGENLKKVRDKADVPAAFQDSDYLMAPRETEVNLGEGSVTFELPVREGLFNQVLSEQCGETITGDAHLLSLMKELVAAKREYDQVAGALSAVQQTGYGLVTPALNEIQLQPPELMRQGSRYGVRLKASAPSIHMMKADITTEISPIVGSEKQSEELVMYLLQEFEDSPEKIWESNIFGKSLHSLVNEGLHNKLYRMPQEARLKLQETIERIINEGCTGLICIII
ncbi:MAG TPA: stage IV sporulation protein A, partial [Ruminococcaceae bacterium]|nr:stage IV sporulation protein A [Oscillospiraceae bacterium]